MDKGEFYELDDIGFAPKPVQKPHPPIWVGGDSPGAFRRVATLGDGWHATSKTPQEMEKSLGALRAAADAAGRSMASIELSVRVSLKEASLRESKQAIVDQLAGYKRLGLTHVVLDFRRDTLAEMLSGAGHGWRWRSGRPSIEAECWRRAGRPLGAAASRTV